MTFRPHPHSTRRIYKGRTHSEDASIVSLHTTSITQRRRFEIPPVWRKERFRKALFSWRISVGEKMLCFQIRPVNCVQGRLFYKRFVAFSFIYRLSQFWYFRSSSLKNQAFSCVATRIWTDFNFFFSGTDLTSLSQSRCVCCFILKRFLVNPVKRESEAHQSPDWLWVISKMLDSVFLNWL